MLTKTLISPFSIPHQTQTIAEQWNDVLSDVNLKALSLYDLESRLDAEMENNQTLTSQLEDAILTLKVNLPKRFATFEDFMANVCDGKMVYLTDIYIDAIMQRKLLLKWIIEILNDVKPTRIMALNVYPSKDINGVPRYACWDGQHTAIVIYIIANLVYGVELENIKVPAVIFKGTKPDIRKNLTALNSTEGKMLLDE